MEQHAITAVKYLKLWLGGGVVDRTTVSSGVGEVEPRVKFQLFVLKPVVTYIYKGMAKVLWPAYVSMSTGVCFYTDQWHRA